MTFWDEMRAIIREEISRVICEAASRVLEDDDYDEFAWKNHEDYDYLVRTGQHLDT